MHPRHDQRVKATNERIATPPGWAGSGIGESSAASYPLLARVMRTWREAPLLVQLRARTDRWFSDPVMGAVLLVGGMAALTLFIVFIDRVVAPIPNPGMIYLPLAAMLAYHWGWRYGLIAGVLDLLCVYILFIPPLNVVKPFTPRVTEQVATVVAVTGFVLAIVQLARARRALAEREAGRFAALNRVGSAVAGELNESRLLNLIARTAQELTGAQFAAFTLRPMNEFGQPVVANEDQLFHLAAVVGVTQEEETLFRSMPLSGAGLLAPIFRDGVPVRVADALVLAPEHDGAAELNPVSTPGVAGSTAFTYIHGFPSTAVPHGVDVPRGHPTVRSFLGAPLLDTSGNVRGGLLLGHNRPDQFTEDDEVLLVGLAAQAAIALENARLYRAAQMQAQELDAIFESIADGIALVDDRGRVVRENGAARRLRDALGMQEADGAVDVLRAAGSHAEESVTVTSSTGAGEVRNYIVSSSRLRPPIQRDLASHADHKEPTGAVVVWRDVTEAHRLIAEQQARAEVEARRALLQTVIDELPSGIYLVQGRDARLLLANRAALDVWGAPWPEGTPMAEFLATSGTRIVGADGRPSAPEEFATVRVVTTGEPVHHHQEIIRHADGTALPILLNAVALDPRTLVWSTPSQADVPGTPPERAALVVLQDVTALKEAERLKDEFIGIAAHELRNPMAALKGFAQMLIEQTDRGRGAPLSEWQREAIEAIDQSTSRLVELTDDLLDVTRLQGGRLELRIEPADLASLARRVVARVAVTCEHHTLAVRAEPEHVVAAIDARRIEQVLTNLINNAIKYSPQGGPVEISIRANAAANIALLSVCDHGIGIPAHQHGRIFGRFARADNAREQGISGTGLGLYLSRELIERHGGRIWFDSTEDKGSTFYIALPLALAPPTDDEACAANATAASTTPSRDALPPNERGARGRRKAQRGEPR